MERIPVPTILQNTHYIADFSLRDATPRILQSLVFFVNGTRTYFQQPKPRMKRTRKMKIASKLNAEPGMELSLSQTSYPKCLNPTLATHPIPKKVLPNLTTTIQMFIPSMGRRPLYSRIYLSLPHRARLHLLDPTQLNRARRPLKHLVSMVVTLSVVGTLLTITINLLLISMRPFPHSQTLPTQLHQPRSRGPRLSYLSAL